MILKIKSSKYNSAKNCVLFAGPAWQEKDPEFNSWVQKYAEEKKSVLILFSLWIAYFKEAQFIKESTEKYNNQIFKMYQ